VLGHSDMIIIVAVVLALVFAGVHIAIALGITAAIGIYLMQGDMEVVRNFIANTAYEALRDYVFAVIPLFMLMGDLLAKCGAARDIYALANRLSRWIRRPIELIHMPVPRERSDDGYFAPLKALDLPPGTELCLGLVHHTDGIDGTRQRLATAQRHVKDFSIATECGFGRRPPDTIPELLRIHAEVAG